MTAFDGLRESWEEAPVRPWQAARRLAAVVLGIMVGAEFAVLLWVLL